MVRVWCSVIALCGLAGAPVAVAMAQPAPSALPSVNYPTALAGSTAMTVLPHARAGLAQAARSRDGHFYMETQLNNASIRMMVDTGATAVTLRWEDAISAGLNPETMTFSVPFSTANGTSYSARARVRSLTVGGITRTDVPVYISKSGALGVSLLGQSFFAQLATFQISGDTLLLKD